MGDLTFDNAHAEAKSMLGERTGVDTRLDRWLNWAHTRLAYRHGIDHHELNIIKEASTASGTRIYALPTNIHSMLSIRDVTNSIKLQWRHWREFDWRDPTATNIPTQFARYGNTLELDPTPNGIYTLRLRFRQSVPTLARDAAPNSKSSLHAIWDEAWVELAAAIGYDKLLEPDRAAYHFALADAIIESLKVPEFEEMDDASYTGMTASVRKGI